MSKGHWIFACLAIFSVCCQTISEHHAADGVAEMVMGTGLKCQAKPNAPQPIDFGRAGAYAVGTLDVELEDHARAIQANAKHPAADFRALPTTIYYPADLPPPPLGAAGVAHGGPFPLLVYSHGYGSNRGEASHLGERAASHGYVVVAADFPFTSTDRLLSGESLDTSDIVNQAGDVSFLIDAMLSFAREPSHVLAGAIDETRIGATGASMGGLTTLLVAFHPTVQDDRVRAVVPIAPLSSFLMTEFYHTRELPLLVLSGDLDAFIDYHLNARRSYERAAPNAQLLTIARGTHAGFALSIDNVTLSLMNALLAPPGADPQNADGFGCAVTGPTLRADSDYLAPLGGKQSFIDYDAVREPWQPCSGDEYKHPGMETAEQLEIATRAAVAFFAAQLGETAQLRESACSYLLHELPKQPGVRVE